MLGVILDPRPCTLRSVIATQATDAKTAAAWSALREQSKTFRTWKGDTRNAKDTAATMAANAAGREKAMKEKQK